MQNVFNYNLVPLIKCTSNVLTVPTHYWPNIQYECRLQYQRDTADDCIPICGGIGAIAPINGTYDVVGYKWIRVC